LFARPRRAAPARAARWPWRDRRAPAPEAASELRRAIAMSVFPPAKEAAAWRGNCPDYRTVSAADSAGLVRRRQRSAARKPAPPLGRAEDSRPRGSNGVRTGRLFGSRIAREPRLGGVSDTRLNGLRGKPFRAPAHARVAGKNPGGRGRAALAKNRLERLARGETVSGGLGKKLDFDKLLETAGITPSDARHAM